MKLLLKLYSISCIVVVAFFAFFSIPWGLLPFSDGINMMIIGGIFAGCAGSYTFYFYRREGFELGWFLLFRGGLWVMTVACLGLAMLLCGSLLFIWPEQFATALERGALPFGILLVSLFWLALILLVAYPAFGMTAKAVAYVRSGKFVESGTNALVALVCTALSGVFFSLFVEVLNDILIRVSAATQWKLIWLFLGLLTGLGIVYGFWNAPKLLLEDTQTDGNIKK